MAGTATNLDGTKIVLGPGYLWADVAVPAGGARMTLATDGTPDATANPNAKNLGYTKGGSVVEFGLETKDIDSDEDTSPILSQVLNSPVSIKAELLQIADFTAILKYVMPSGTYGTGSGYKQMTVGGIAAINYYSFALICPTVADATKFMVIQLYKAYNKSPFSFNITRKDAASGSIELYGLSVGSRSAGDRVGNFWQQA